MSAAVPTDPPTPGPTGGFRTATAVHRVPNGTPQSGPSSRWNTEIRPGWDIADNANGGYLLAIVARAMAGALDRPDPVTITGHYLSPGRAGAATVDVYVVREGRRFATASATLVRDDRPVLTCLGTFGDLRDAVGPELVDAAPPELPPPHECVDLGSSSGFPPPFNAKIEMRLHPEDAAFATGRPSGRALMRGWFRLRDDEPVDTVALLCAVDAFPPTAFNAHLPLAWTPTIELTAHLRARPEPGWLRCRFTTRFVTGGFLEEDGEAWDATGRLVAQSRQLALVPQR